MRAFQHHTFGLVVTSVLLVYLLAAGCSSSSSPTSTSTPLIVSSDKTSQDGDVLPRHIADAALAALPDGVIVAATREEEDDDEVVYEVLVETAEGPFEVDLAPDGTILEIEEAADDEREIAPSELPDVVLAAVAATVPGGRITEAVRESVRGRVVYDVEVDVRGRKFDLEIDAEGNVLEVDEGD